MIVEIYKMLTPSQRENLLGQVEHLALDFQKLSLKD